MRFRARGSTVPEMCGKLCSVVVALSSRKCLQVRHGVDTLLAVGNAVAYHRGLEPDRRVLASAIVLTTANGFGIDVLAGGALGV